MHFVIALLLPVLAAADEKKPIATVQPEPSVRVEGQPVLTVKPIHDAGLPDEHAITAERAYELLRDEARNMRTNAQLYSLDTAMYALSPEGKSSGWVAEFLTETPGEMLRVAYESGEVEILPLGLAPPDRPGVPDADGVGYDVKKLYDETVKYAAGVVDPISRVTASLYRSVGTGKALWLLNVYGDDDRIGQTVVFDAKTMKFSHKTN